MTVKVIEDNATFVSGIFTRSYTLRNAGENDVYLGQDSSLTIHSRALTLTRGATVQWDGSTELWAVCATGETSELEWVYEAASSVTDGAQYTEISGDVNLAPGSTVGIDGTVTVGGSVDISGGTVGISGDVTVQGDVNVDGSTINVGTPVSLKSDLTLLGSTSLVWGAGAGTYTGGPFNVDVTDYSSILLVVDTGAFIGIPTTENNYLQLIPAFTNAAGTIIARRHLAQWLLVALVGTGNFSLHLPVTGERFSLPSIDIGKAATVAGGTATVYIYGSHAAIDTPKYIHKQIGGDYPSSGEYGVTFSSSQTVFLSTENGNTIYTVTKGSTGGASGIAILRYAKSGALLRLHYQRVLTGDLSESTLLTTLLSLPMLPVLLTYSLSTAGNVDIALLKTD